MGIIVTVTYKLYRGLKKSGLNVVIIREGPTRQGPRARIRVKLHVCVHFMACVACANSLLPMTASVV